MQLVYIRACAVERFLWPSLQIKEQAFNCSVYSAWFLRRVSAYPYRPCPVSRFTIYRYVANVSFAGRTAVFGNFCPHRVCTHIYIFICLLRVVPSVLSDGSAGNITAGCGLVEDRLPRAVSATVKRASVSHRQVGLFAQLDKVELKALLSSNATMLLQPLECIALPQQHNRRSSKAKA